MTIVTYGWIFGMLRGRTFEWMKTTAAMCKVTQLDSLEDDWVKQIALNFLTWTKYYFWKELKQYLSGLLSSSGYRTLKTPHWFFRSDNIWYSYWALCWKPSQYLIRNEYIVFIHNNKMFLCKNWRWCKILRLYIFTSIKKDLNSNIRALCKL